MAKRKSLLKTVANGSTQLFLSSEIKLFPSSKRSDVFDRNAKLNTEQNLISIINRLTGKDSFVIDGLKIDSGSITAGSCNIHGYLITLMNSVQIDSSLTSNVSDGEYLCFQIRTEETTVSTNSGTVKYTELAVIDESVLKATDVITDNIGGRTIARSLDSTSDASKFYGVGLIIRDNLDTYKKESGFSDRVVESWFLPIAVWKNSKWNTIISDDGTVANNRWNTQRINANDIMIEANKSLYANEYYNKRQDLETFLENNMILDDGIIE